MKTSHYKTPRTLAECQFDVRGYRFDGEIIADVITAIVIGIALAGMLVHWWAS